MRRRSRTPISSIQAFVKTSLRRDEIESRKAPKSFVALVPDRVDQRRRDSGGRCRSASTPGRSRSYRVEPRHPPRRSGLERSALGTETDLPSPSGTGRPGVLGEDGGLRAQARRERVDAPLRGVDREDRPNRALSLTCTCGQSCRGDLRRRYPGRISLGPAALGPRRPDGPLREPPAALTGSRSRGRGSTRPKRRRCGIPRAGRSGRRGGG